MENFEKSLLAFAVTNMIGFSLTLLFHNLFNSSFIILSGVPELK